MILTLYYMYATVLQWWRLGALKNKINGTLNSKNALLLSSSQTINTSKRHRGVENLLFHVDDRIGCTIVPKQILNLSIWISFPKDPRTFPIHINFGKYLPKPPFVYLMIKCVLENYKPHNGGTIQIEDFGEPMAWKAGSKFELLLRTDNDSLAKLVHCFRNCSLDINHDLQIMEIETVDIDGTPNKIKYDRKYSLSETLKYSRSPIHWKKFATEIKDLYLKIRENSNPKIKIENGGGKIEEQKKVPIYEVKPIKKEPRKQAEEKNTLEVTINEHRRHKSTEKRDKLDDKHKDRRSKEEPVKVKDAKLSEAKPKPKHQLKDATSKSADKVELPKVEKAKIKVKRDKSKEKPSSEQDQKEKIPNTSKHKEKKVDIQETTAAAIKQPDEVIKRKEMNIIETKSNKNNINTGLAKKLTSNAKPPNILVHADSVTAKENVKTVLNSVINTEKYIVYDLPFTSPGDTTWCDSAVLVVICGTTTPELTSQLLEYLVRGGHLLCLCSDLLHSILSVFSTAEVREHELVRFSYGEWKRVKMMHHIFCYQASPAKKQFSKESVESNHSNGSSPIAPRTPSTAEIQHNGRNYTLQVQVLGTEETWQTPSLLLANVKNSKGKAVFSQVHLEIDPLQYEADESRFSALKDSNQARLEILKDILSNRLEIDCSDSVGRPEFSPAYFLGRHDMKLAMLSECKDIVENTLDCGKISLVFCGKNVDPGTATSSRLPVMLLSCPSTFSTVEYFSTLTTDHIGRLVIYADMLTSSHLLLAKSIQHGLVVIPRQQCGAVGRSNNSWLSPVGCACFSLQLHVPLSSPLGRTLSIIQHLAAVAIVEAVKKIPGYENLSLGIKWPNDIYVDGEVKIGGILVTSSIGHKTALVNIGCAVNLDNKNPTVCINDYILEYNKTNGTALAKLTAENYFATVFNEFENLYDTVQNDNMDVFYDLYYKHWIHQDTQVKITEDGKTRNALITGIDDFGFLKVKLDSGEITTVQPDGNSFDLVKGLIAPKPHYKN